MNWVELSTVVLESSADRVAAVLGKFGRGGAAVEELEPEPDGSRRSIVKIYLTRHNLKTNECELARQVNALPFKIELTERIIRQEDWFESLKQHFGIQEIGDRFIVKPSWIQDKLPESTRIIIEMDPGAAFGTGLHPTTRMCLLWLDKHLKPGMLVFDLGTGTGVLSIAAAKLGAGEVEAVDIDPLAVSAARQNVCSNGVNSQVHISRGTLSLARQRYLKNSVDLLLANISGNVISDLSGRIAAILKPGGRAICSGFIKNGLDEVMIRLALTGLKIEGADRDGDWYAVVALKTE